MSSFGPSPRRRRLALSVGGALAAMLMVAPGASAQFTLAECGGSLAPGRGASFQNTAFSGFRSLYGTESDGCGAAALNALTWDGAGSGAGRRALGERSAPNTNGDRDPSVRWAGSDEPPTQAQREQMEKGAVVPGTTTDLTAADNSPLHVVPAAMGAIAILVHLPAGCVDYGAVGNDLFRDRPKTALTALEDVFRGTAATWGDLIPTLLPNDNTCRQAPIKRAVRRDSSGTTYALRQLLAKIDPANAADWKTRAGGAAWPNDTGATTVVKAATDGGSALTDLALATPGTLGYVDLATARARGAGAYTWDGAAAPIDRTFWLPLQSSTTDTGNYFDPQANAQGYKPNTPVADRGANCTAVQPTGIPSSTLGDWTNADSSMSEDGYAACTLTYNLLFDDNAVVYCKSPAEEAKARTIKDYFTKAVVSPAGQATLPGSDYARVPGAILDVARAGVNAIGWNKGGTGRPCGDEQPPPPPGGGGDTNNPPAGGGGGTTPPPAAPSNDAKLASTRAVGTTIRLSLQFPGPGKVSVTSSAKPKKGKAVKLATKTVDVTKAGSQTISLSLNSKAKSALRKDKKLKFTLKITYTPTGGSAKTVTKTITVKQPKSSKK
ncbi:hypothetical protein DVA67_028945 [Solirubrobacter sp. CPCC 204708]|uniref:Substrate-binding domain-containing protein n=1 Tax=Solirubrobacter deserti TaxID=2282478 RepID=A0ABT4RTR2_9ACTN|nr:substrate-binding domain-containing protein [Solirubrobacter deserti]MBE2320027.1 hypothetical protein [Solirubrobacter deserti]MDA0141971.1 substrate-binding domain-containing protein [Solirubrobacter deserti]